MKFMLLLATLSLLVSGLFAQDDSDSKEKKHPIDVWLEAAMEKDSSTAGMVMACSKASDKWDAEMNKVYKELMNSLSPSAAEALRNAQRKWVEQRDAEYEFIAEFYGKADGTMWRVVAADAAMQIVRERALTLQGYLNSQSEM